MLEDGGVVSRDLFDTKLMNCLTPRPAQVIAKFREDYAEDPKKATDDYYNFSVATNYIRKDRIAQRPSLESDRLSMVRSILPST